MTIFEYIIEYIENEGVSYKNKNEYTDMTEGIKLYMLENGIDEKESRKYFIDYVTRHMHTIDTKDLKGYFTIYPLISKINQLLTESRQTGKLSKDKVSELSYLVEVIGHSECGDKYIPIDDIKMLFFCE